MCSVCVFQTYEQLYLSFWRLHIDLVVFSFVRCLAPRRASLSRPWVSFGCLRSSLHGFLGLSVSLWFSCNRSYGIPKTCSTFFLDPSHKKFFLKSLLQSYASVGYHIVTPSIRNTVSIAGLFFSSFTSPLLTRRLYSASSFFFSVLSPLYLKKRS